MKVPDYHSMDINMEQRMDNKKEIITTWNDYLDQHNKLRKEIEQDISPELINKLRSWINVSLNKYQIPSSSITNFDIFRVAHWCLYDSDTVTGYQGPVSQLKNNHLLNDLLKRVAELEELLSNTSAQNN